MKEATGELNMTLITINIIGVILAGVTLIVPRVLNQTKDIWGTESPENCVNFGMTETENCQ